MTDWKAGTVLVDSNGRPVRRDTLVLGGIMTVYPRNQPSNRERPGDFTEQGLATDQTS